MSTRKPVPARTAPRVNRWVFPAAVAGVVALGILAVVLVASGGGGDDGGDGGGAAVEVAAEVRVDGSSLPDYPGAGRDPAAGMAAPALASVGFDGEAVRAGGDTGRPYALVFLAHWCPHCQAEVPRLVDAAEGRRIEGVDVVGVATGTSSRQPNYPPSDWLAGEGWRFAVLLDDARGTAAGAYGLTGYPFMVFVDASGTVVGRISGEVGEDDLRRIFAALAAGDPLPLPGAGASSRG